MRTTTTVALGLAAMTLGACADLPGRRAVVAAPRRCADQVVQVYFEPQSAEMTPEGRAVIVAAATASRGCKVTAVEVTGLSDAAGAPQANLELSRRRAQSVVTALTSAGLPPATFSVGAQGQAGATTAGGRTEPLRRRVDVALRLSPT